MKLLRKRKLPGTFSGKYIFLCLILLTFVLHGRVTGAESVFSSTISTIKVDSVSVLPNNHIIIGWTLVTDAEEGFVEIHRKLDSGLYAVINTVPLSQSYYIDNGINAQNKAYSYYVVARYLDGDNIAVSLEAHQTIFLDQPPADICSRLFTLNWENYSLTTTAGQPQPLPSPFNRNFIEMSFDGGEFQQVLETAAQVPTALTVADQPGNYCFRIKTKQDDTGITSTSNVRCRQVNFLPEPQFIYLRKVSISEGNQVVEIHLHTDNSVPDPAYVFKRMGDSPDDLLVLDTIVSSDGNVYFQDDQAQPVMQAEYYIVEMLDSCRISALETELISTIYLTVDQSSPGINFLQWNSYEGWIHSGVDGYVVLRKTSDETGFENLASLPPGSNSYTDDLSFTNPDQLTGSITYRILAAEAFGNPFGFRDTVFSNSVELVSDVQIFVPTAFKPMSQIPENRIFKAFFPFFTPSSYSLVVINKWGTQVFSSNDIHYGWDGTHNGSPAPAGVYSWIINFTDENGIRTEKRGAVILIR